MKRRVAADWADEAELVKIDWANGSRGLPNIFTMLFDEIMDIKLLLNYWINYIIE